MTPNARRSPIAHAAVLALATLGATVPPTGALAQQAGASDVQVITVTSQRRVQELQKVPLPISALRAEELQARAITDTLKVATFVPNMFASNNTGLGTANVYYIRGLGNTESIATFDPPVGTYVDDIYISRQNANNFSFFDVERIEVLRGPQGTLFGRNTTGGAMRVILKRPSFTAGGFLGVGIGSYGEKTARGSYDLPFGETLASKLSFFVKQDDGYVDNVTTGEKVNDADAKGVRGALRLRLGANLSWDVALEGSEDNAAAVQNAIVDGNRVTRTGLKRNNSRGFLNAAGAPMLVGEKQNYGLGNRVKSLALTSNVRWSLSDAMSLEFITGLRDMTQKFALDFLNGPGPNGAFTIVNDGEHKQFSQEVKAVGEAGSLTWVAGAYFMKEDNRTDFADTFGTLLLADRVLDNTTTSAAVYAQADFKLGAALTATAGLRWTNEKKEVAIFDNRTTPALAARLDTANLVAAGVPIALSKNVATPRFALAYQADRDTMYFASATRGFKSGGWNARSTSTATFQPFEAETIWSYEAGWRATYLGNRVRFNGTVFKSTTTKLQTPSAFTAPSGAVSFITRNFADLGNQGLELDLNVALTPDLNLYTALGTQDAEYKNIAPQILAQQQACRDSIAAGAASRPSCLNGIVDRDGNIAPPVRVPAVTVNFGGDYTLRMGGLKLTGAAHWAYSSRTSVGTASNAFAEGHTVVNASLALAEAKDKWRLTLDCSNCSDKVWIQSFLAGLNYLPDPRRYTLKFHYSL
jgi:iron complex outermembrane receptor protein